MKPKYLTMCFITVLIILEGIILEIQKFIGPKFILPKFLKLIRYNYYIGAVEEEDIKINKLYVIFFM